MCLPNLILTASNVEVFVKKNYCKHSMCFAYRTLPMHPIWLSIPYDAVLLSVATWSPLIWLSRSCRKQCVFLNIYIIKYLISVFSSSFSVKSTNELKAQNNKQHKQLSVFSEGELLIYLLVKQSLSEILYIDNCLFSVGH